MVIGGHLACNLTTLKTILSIVTSSSVLKTYTFNDQQFFFFPTPAGTGSLFSKIGCNEKAMHHLLGGHVGVEDDNVMQYLGVVEQRANHLILSSAYIDSQVR